MGKLRLAQVLKTSSKSGWTSSSELQTCHYHKLSKSDGGLKKTVGSDRVLLYTTPALHGAQREQMNVPPEGLGPGASQGTDGP